MPWPSLFVDILWELWKARNAKVFTREVPSPVKVVDKAIKLTKDSGSLLSKVQSGGHAVADWITWRSLDYGWLKLNMDGARKNNTKMMSAGGLMRDHRSGWVVGFTVKTGTTTSFAAELWDLREGL